MTRSALVSLFEGLYVGAKHRDTIAVELYCERLDAVGASFASQNLIFRTACDDRCVGIPSAVIADAVCESGIAVSMDRPASVGHVLRSGEARGFDLLTARQCDQRRRWGES